MVIITEISHIYLHLTTNMKIEIIDYNIWKANLLLLLISLVYLTFSKLIISNFFLGGFILFEITAILPLSLAFLYSSEHCIKDIISIKNIKRSDILYTIGIIIFTYPSIACINFLSTRKALFSESINLSIIRQNMSLSDLLVSLFIFAIVPAICEELLFRGAIYNSYTALNFKIRIFINSFMFAILHFNKSNFIGPFLLSIILIYLLDRTKTIIIPILGHFIYNSLGLSMIVFQLYNYEIIQYIPRSDANFFLFLIFAISLLLLYPAYRLYNRVELSHRTRSEINNIQIKGQITLFEYYDNNNFINSRIRDKILLFIPLIIVVLLYLTIL